MVGVPASKAPAPLKRAAALFVTARCVESPADISYHSHHLAPPELLKLLSLSRLRLGKPRQVPAPITIQQDLDRRHSSLTLGRETLEAQDWELSVIKLI